MALTAKQANLNFHVIISVWRFHVNVLSIIIPKNFMLVILDFILLILLFQVCYVNYHDSKFTYRDNKLMASSMVNFTFATFTVIIRQARRARAVQRLGMGWAAWGSNPSGGKNFRTHPDRSWGPPSPLYNGYQVFPGDKAAGHGVDHPPPSSADVKEIVELYHYSPQAFVACSTFTVIIRLITCFTAL